MPFWKIWFLYRKFQPLSHHFVRIQSPRVYNWMLHHYRSSTNDYYPWDRFHVLRFCSYQTKTNFSPELSWTSHPKEPRNQHQNDWDEHILCQLPLRYRQSSASPYLCHLFAQFYHWSGRYFCLSKLRIYFWFLFPSLLWWPLPPAHYTFSLSLGVFLLLFITEFICFLVNWLFSLTHKLAACFLHELYHIRLIYQKGALSLLQAMFSDSLLFHNIHIILL